MTMARIVVMTVITFKMMMLLMLMKKYTFTESCHALNNGVTSEAILYIYFNEQHGMAEKILLSSMGNTSLNQTQFFFTHQITINI